MATIDSLDLKATPLTTDTIELNDGNKAALGSLPVSTAQASADATVKAACQPIAITTNKTAVFGETYEVYASATFTDPTPPTTGGYEVLSLIHI